MNIGERGISLIKSFEKLRLTAYKPTPNDVWTVGYGSTKDVEPGMTITEEEADERLLLDLHDAETCVRKRCTGINITQGQYDAMVSLVFNIGCGNFSGSTVLRKLLDGDDDGACEAFLMWIKQKNKKTGALETLAGLTRRRLEEQALFRSS